MRSSKRRVRFLPRSSTVPGRGRVIDSLREDGFGLGPVCRVLGWSESAYYARKKRPKSARRLRDEQLMALIQQVHTIRSFVAKPGSLRPLGKWRAGV